MSRIPPPSVEAHYLGDGAYAEFDGEQVWIKAEREDGWHGVAIDRHAFRLLMEVVKPLGWLPPPH